MTAPFQTQAERTSIVTGQELATLTDEVLVQEVLDSGTPETGQDLWWVTPDLASRIRVRLQYQNTQNLLDEPNDTDEDDEIRYVPTAELQRQFNATIDEALYSSDLPRVHLGSRWLLEVARSISIPTEYAGSEEEAVNYVLEKFHEAQQELDDQLDALLQWARQIGANNALHRQTQEEPAGSRGYTIARGTPDDVGGRVELQVDPDYIGVPGNEGQDVSDNERHRWSVIQRGRRIQTPRTASIRRREDQAER